MGRIGDVAGVTRSAVLKHITVILKSGEARSIPNVLRVHTYVIPEVNVQAVRIITFDPASRGGYSEPLWIHEVIRVFVGRL